MSFVAKQSKFEWSFCVRGLFCLSACRRAAMGGCQPVGYERLMAMSCSARHLSWLFGRVVCVFLWQLRPLSDASAEAGLASLIFYSLSYAGAAFLHKNGSRQAGRMGLCKNKSLHLHLESWASAVRAARPASFWRGTPAGNTRTQENNNTDGRRAREVYREVRGANAKQNIEQ